MSTGDLRNASLSGSSTPPPIAPNYGSTVPRSQSDTERPRYARAATGGRFLSSIHGLLNMIIIVSKDLFLLNNKFIFEYYSLHFFV